MSDCVVRYAERSELERVNELRAMVNELHVEGRPDIFRPGFTDELKNYIYQKFDSENSDVIAALIDGTICGFAMVEYIDRPASPYRLSQHSVVIDELGVDDAYRRRGVASALVAFCRQEARRKGFERIELNMWEFNEAALSFYEAVGFRTFRRYLELDL